MFCVGVLLGLIFLLFSDFFLQTINAIYDRTFPAEEYDNKDVEDNCKYIAGVYWTIVDIWVINRNNDFSDYMTSNLVTLIKYLAQKSKIEVSLAKNLFFTQYEKLMFITSIPACSFYSYRYYMVSCCKSNSMLTKHLTKTMYNLFF